MGTADLSSPRSWAEPCAPAFSFRAVTIRRGCAKAWKAGLLDPGDIHAECHGKTERDRWPTTAGVLKASLQQLYALCALLKKIGDRQLVLRLVGLPQCFSPQSHLDG
jgi:hypothetical protein